MSRMMKLIYKQSFIEQIETLLPEHYTLNKYYESKINSNQYIMRNSKGYFHIMEIVKTKYGFTFNHYRIDKNEKIIDTGEHYSYYDTIEAIKNSIEQEETAC
mgnify:CR=1 FL=1